MKSSKIREIDNYVRAKYTYKYDRPEKDEWRSRHTEVLAGKPWQGDCDDLASTTAYMLTKYGLPLSSAWLCLVDSSGDGKIDHAIAMCKDDEGKTWVIGDTFGQNLGGAYPLKQMKHALKKWCRYDDILMWYEGSTIQ